MLLELSSQLAIILLCLQLMLPSVGQLPWPIALPWYAEMLTPFCCSKLARPYNRCIVQSFRFVSVWTEPKLWCCLLWSVASLPSLQLNLRRLHLTCPQPSSVLHLLPFFNGSFPGVTLPSSVELVNSYNVQLNSLHQSFLVGSWPGISCFVHHPQSSIYP